jgi:hypothetical protein
VVVQLLEIRPKPPHRVLGGVRLPPKGQMVWPHPPWHYHFAVFAGLLVRDEFYPHGIPMGEYQQKFEHSEAINFVLHRAGI